MSTWQDLVRASLLGTERTGVPPATVPGVPILPDAPPDIPFPNNPARDDPAPANPAPANPAPDNPALANPVSDSAAPDDPAILLLEQAALLTVARRGGRLAQRAEPLPVAEPDPAPAVSPAAARRLARMLGGEHPDLLTEWLTAVVSRGRRAPAQLLPALLDRVRRVSPADPELRRLAAEAGGSRARWLAGLNPDWKFVTAHTLTGGDAWRLGDARQRRGYLAALRARDPGTSRELIAGSWDAAGPGERVMFVNVMADGLSLADEPLLEAALDDRDAWVRTRAADVLAALPGSALAQRMAARALGCLSLHQDRRGTRLVTIPPVQCDAAMRRDGITPGPSAVRTHLAGQAHLMLEVLARSPLRTWTDRFRMTPAEIVSVPSGDWAPVLFAGWARAAIAQSNQDQGAREWMAALISTSLADGRPGLPSGAETLSRLARRADPALGAPGALADPPPNAPAVLADAVRVLRFRYEMLKEFDDDHGDG